MKQLAILFLTILALSSCKRDEEIKPLCEPKIDTTGFLEIHVSNTVGNLPLVLGSTNYVTSVSDTFNVDIFKYYLSNVKLISASGYTYTEVESYFLIDQSNPSSLHLMVKNVPSDSYTSINFLIGVDSAKNTSGAQTGALDPSNGMFWGWNTGYIMAKMEGYSPQSTEFTNKLVFHIGGFSGKNNSLRTVNLSFPNAANCSQHHTPILNLKADLGAWFASPNFTNFNTLNVATGITPESSAIADNYANMFSVTSVIN